MTLQGSIATFGVITALMIVLYSVTSPHSVGRYGPLSLGGPAPLQPGIDVAVHPFLNIPQSNFYVYAVEKGAQWCVWAECGMPGALVECMGGWLSGEAHPENADLFGLEGKWDQVENETVSLLVVADRQSMIVGIYPGLRVNDLPQILKKHADLSPMTRECFAYHGAPF